MAKTSKKTVLINQKSSDEELFEVLIDEGKQFVFSDSVEHEFLLITKAKDFFKQTSSLSRTINLLVTDCGLTPINARKIFEKMGKLYSNINRSLYRELLIDKLFENIEETREKAKNSDDPAAMAKCDDNLAKAIKDFLGTNDAIDQEKLRLPDVIAAFHPEWFPDVPAINSKEYEMIITNFKIRKDKKARMEAQDIDYEDV